MRATENSAQLDLFWLEILGRPETQKDHVTKGWITYKNFSIALILGNYEADMSTAMEIRNGGEGAYTVTVTDLTGSYSPTLGFTLTAKSRDKLFRKVSAAGNLWCTWPLFFYLVEWELWKTIRKGEKRQ